MIESAYVYDVQRDQKCFLKNHKANGFRCAFNEATGIYTFLAGILGNSIGISRNPVYSPWDLFGIP